MSSMFAVGIEAGGIAIGMGKIIGNVSGSNAKFANAVPYDPTLDLILGEGNTLTPYNAVFGSSGTGTKRMALGPLFNTMKAPGTSRVMSVFPIRVGMRPALAVLGDRL